MLEADLEPSQLKKWISGLTACARPNLIADQVLFEDFTAEQLYCMVAQMYLFGQLENSTKEIELALNCLASYCFMLQENFRYPLYEDDAGNFGKPHHLGVNPMPDDLLCYLKGSN